VITDSKFLSERFPPLTGCKSKNRRFLLKENKRKPPSSKSLRARQVTLAIVTAGGMGAQICLRKYFRGRFTFVYELLPTDCIFIFEFGQISNCGQMHRGFETESLAPAAVRAFPLGGVPTLLFSRWNRSGGTDNQKSVAPPQVNAKVKFGLSLFRFLCAQNPKRALSTTKIGTTGNVFTAKFPFFIYSPGEYGRQSPPIVRRHRSTPCRARSIIKTLAGPCASVLL